MHEILILADSNMMSSQPARKRRRTSGPSFPLSPCQPPLSPSSDYDVPDLAMENDLAINIADLIPFSQLHRLVTFNDLSTIDQTLMNVIITGVAVEAGASLSYRVRAVMDYLPKTYHARLLSRIETLKAQYDLSAPHNFLEFLLHDLQESWMCSRLLSLAFEHGISPTVGRNYSGEIAPNDDEHFHLITQENDWRQLGERTWRSSHAPFSESDWNQVIPFASHRLWWSTISKWKRYGDYRDKIVRLVDEYVGDHPDSLPFFIKPEDFRLRKKLPEYSQLGPICDFADFKRRRRDHVQLYDTLYDLVMFEFHHLVNLLAHHPRFHPTGVKAFAYLRRVDLRHYPQRYAPQVCPSCQMGSCFACHLHGESDIFTRGKFICNCGNCGGLGLVPMITHNNHPGWRQTSVINAKTVTAKVEMSCCDMDSSWEGADTYTLDEVRAIRARHRVDATNPFHYFNVGQVSPCRNARWCYVTRRLPPGFPRVREIRKIRERCHVVDNAVRIATVLDECFDGALQLTCNDNQVALHCYFPAFSTPDWRRMLLLRVMGRVSYTVPTVLPILSLFPTDVVHVVQACSEPRG